MHTSKLQRLTGARERPVPLAHISITTKPVCSGRRAVSGLKYDSSNRTRPQPGHQCRVLSRDAVESEAEQFIRSMQQSIPEDDDSADLNARNIEELQERLRNLQQQVR